MNIERGSLVRVRGTDTEMSADYPTKTGTWFCHWFDGKDWHREEHPETDLELVDG